MFFLDKLQPCRCGTYDKFKLQVSHFITCFLIHILNWELLLISLTVFLYFLGLASLQKMSLFTCLKSFLVWSGCIVIGNLLHNYSFLSNNSCHDDLVSSAKCNLMFNSRHSSATQSKSFFKVLSDDKSVYFISFQVNGKLVHKLLFTTLLRTVAQMYSATCKQITRACTCTLHTCIHVHCTPLRVALLYASNAIEIAVDMMKYVSRDRTSQNDSSSRERLANISSLHA